MSSAEIDDVANLLSQTKVDVQNEVVFPGNGLKLNSKEDVKDFCDDIRKCGQMTALRLEGNSFGVEASQAIGDALKEHPELEKAYWSDMFTGRLKNEIPNALEYLGGGIMAAGAGLVTLELSDNAFGPNGLRGLTTFLKSESCYTLKELKLNNNGLGIYGGRMLSESLIECHANSCKAGRPLALRVFVSGRNRLDNPGATALADAFKTIGTLEEITMLQNFIQHEGVSAIAEAIRHNPKLRLLNLNDNTFTERGSQSMAKVLPELKELEIINFGDCLIRTNGARSLSQALVHNHKLKQILLNGNEIGLDAIDDLVECARTKTQLETFDLNCNEFGSDGVERLQALMEENGCLDALSSLSDDEGDDDDCDEVENDSDSDTGISERLQETTVDSPSPDIKITQQNVVVAPTVTCDEFLRNPTPSKFTQLGPEGYKELTAYFSTMAIDTDNIVNLFVQMAQSGDSIPSINDVYACTDELLRRLFDSDCNSALVINTLLSYLGLIKHEDKKYTPPSDIGATVSVLEHTVKQSYFNKSARTMLRSFIDRPHPLLEKCTTQRHKLLQTLYSL